MIFGGTATHREHLESAGRAMKIMGEIAPLDGTVRRDLRPVELSEEQFERYARHLILDEVGEEGQVRLL